MSVRVPRICPGNGAARRTLQDVEADAAQLVHVGVEDLCQEADLGRRHGIVVGEEELELEDAACAASVTTLQSGRYTPWRGGQPSYGDWAGPWISTSK